MRIAIAGEYFGQIGAIQAFDYRYSIFAQFCECSLRRYDRAKCTRYGCEGMKRKEKALGKYRLLYNKDRALRALANHCVTSIQCGLTDCHSRGLFSNRGGSS